MKWTLAYFLSLLCVSGQSPLFWPHYVVQSASTITNTTSGLVNWWKFDENSGTTASDSKDSATGTLQASPPWVPGQINSAIQFGVNGSQYIQLSTNCSIGSGAITVSYWTFRTNASADGGYVLADTDVSGFTGGLKVLHDSGNISLIMTCTGSQCLRSTTTGTPKSTWVFVVMTYAGTLTDGTGIHMYTNLVELPYSTTGNGSGSHGPNTTTDRYIAKQQSGTFYNGILDDIRIYNRVLTLGEMTNMFNWRGQP